MNIGAASRQSGMPTKTIRYYDEIGLVSPAARADNGYRDYSDRDIQMLKFIGRARDLGFSVRDCENLLSLYQDHDRASADVKQIALDHVAGSDRKLKELASMRDTLMHLVNECHGDDRPDCPILNDLAEGKE